jgi:hypothetical protein
MNYDTDDEVLKIKINTTEFPIDSQPFTVSKENKAVLLVTIFGQGVERFIEPQGRGTTDGNTNIDNFQLRIIFVDINKSANLSNVFVQNGVAVKLSQEKASEAQKNGSALFVGTLTEPWAGREKPESARIQTGSSGTVMQKAQIYLDVSEIWLFNKSTGEIYAKFKQ